MNTGTTITKEEFLKAIVTNDDLVRTALVLLKRAKGFLPSETSFMISLANIVEEHNAGNGKYHSALSAKQLECARRSMPKYAEAVVVLLNDPGNNPPAEEGEEASGAAASSFPSDGPPPDANNVPFDGRNPATWKPYMKKGMAHPWDF